MPETIGENLMAILGIIPVRDRAGIARSNLAVEAAKSKEATDQMMRGPQAPMQMPQGTAPTPQAPPQFKPPQELLGQNGQLQLPGGMSTDYMSGKPQAPPPSQERVIASSPAAAPSPAVQAKASDVLLAQYEQQQRQQKMRQIIGSLGMIANAFNRDPHSAAATQASLAGMVGGGRGHGGDGSGDLKTILDYRGKEEAAAANEKSRINAIDILRKQGLSLEEATAEVDLGVKDRLGQGAAFTRADREAKAQAEREAVDNLVKRGMSREDALVEVKSGAYTSRLGQAAEITRADRATAEKARSAGIDELVKTRNLTPEQAAVEYDSGTYKDRFGQKSEQERAERKTEEDLRTKLEPQIDDIARATGSDPHILRAQLKAAGGPQKILDQMTPEKRATVGKLEADRNKAEMETIPMAAKLAGWKRIIADPDAAEAAGITPQQAAEFRHNPTALNEFIEARAKKQGELKGASGTAAAAQQREKFVKEKHGAAEADEDYLVNTAPELARLFGEGKVISGTWQDVRRTNVWRPLATLLGKSDAELTTTAQLESALSQLVAKNAKALGTNPTDEDARIIAKIQGGLALSPSELEGVFAMNERAARQRLRKTNDDIEQNARVSPEMRGEFNQVRKFDLDKIEPSEILQKRIYSDGSKGLRQGLQKFHAQMEAAMGTPGEKQAIKEYNEIKKDFDRHFGTATSIWYLGQERR